MAAPALNLDLSAIAVGSPEVPDPIANAFATIQTTLSALGNVHLASDANIASSKLAGAKSTRRFFIPLTAFKNGLESGVTFMAIVTEHLAMRYADAVASWAYTDFVMPIDWTGGDFTVTTVATSGGTSGGSVNQKLRAWLRRSSVLMSATPTQTVTTSGSPPSVAAQPYAITGILTGANFASGDSIQLQLYCDRTTSDTNTDPHYILGVYIDYPSTI